MSIEKIKKLENQIKSLTDEVNEMKKVLNRTTHLIDFNSGKVTFKKRVQFLKDVLDKENTNVIN